MGEELKGTLGCPKIRDILARVEKTRTQLALSQILTADGSPTGTAGISRDLDHEMGQRSGN